MRLRSILAALATATVLIGCGGSHGGDGGGTTPPPPTATLSGIAFASTPFQSGTITAYSFASGTKGPALASTTIVPGGNYSLTVPAGVPVLLEVAGGCYTETGTDRVFARVQTNVCLAAGESLQGLFTAAGGTNQVNVTPYTHAAAGLAQYLLAHGSNVASAIATANQRLSQLVGLDITFTAPAVPDANATATGPNKYGALLGGMASWIYSLRNTPGFVYGVAPYTTVHFSELLRNDLAHDGVLDGIGSDVGGNATALTIANAPVDATVDRHQIAAYAATRIRGETDSTHYGRVADFLPFLKAYNNSTDALFGSTSVTALDEGGAKLSNITPQSGYVETSGTLWVYVVIEDIVGVQIGKAELLVDGVFYQPYPDQTGLVRQFVNTTIFANGSHLITVRATNFLNTVTTSSVTITFQN